MEKSHFRWTNFWGAGQIVSCGEGAIRRCARRRRDCADHEPADVVGGIPRCRGRMVSDVAVENVEWAGRGIPNVYHCRCGVFGYGATRANSRLVVYTLLAMGRQTRFHMLPEDCRRFVLFLQERDPVIVTKWHSSGLAEIQEVN